MDLDLIRSVLVKEFPHFGNRLGTREPNSTLDKNNLMRNVLTMKKGEDWKRIRNVITPAFTTGKMRKLVPLLEHSANELRSVIQRFVDEGKEIPMKDTMGRVSIDMIARCGFAVDIDSFNRDKESPFVTHSKGLLDGRRWSFFFLFTFPYLADRMQSYLGIDFLGTDAVRFFYDILDRLYQRRKSDPQAHVKFNDLFQLLLDAVDDEQHKGAEISTEDKEIVHEKVRKNSGKHISKIEVLAQCFVLLVDPLLQDPLIYSSIH